MGHLEALPDDHLSAILARLPRASACAATVVSRRFAAIVCHSGHGGFWHARDLAGALEARFVSVGGTRSVISDAVHFLEPGMAGWRRATVLPGGPRAEHTAVAYQSSLWVIGGVCPADWIDIDDALRSVEVYNIAAGAWRDAPPPLQRARLAHAAGVVDGRLVVCGGGGDAGGDAGFTFPLLDSCEVLDLRPSATDGGWAFGAPMPIGVWHAACAAVAERRLLVAGGDTGPGRNGSCVVQVYEDEAWRVLERLALPQPRYGAGAALMSEQTVVVFGGLGSWYSTAMSDELLDMPAEEEQEEFERAADGCMLVSVLELQEGGRRAQWRWEGNDQRAVDAPVAPVEFTGMRVSYTAAVGDGRGRAIIACQGHQSWWELDESWPRRSVRALDAGPPGDPQEPSHHLDDADILDGTRHVLACVWL